MTVDTARNLLVIIFGLLGIFSIAAGIGGWKWFYASLNTRILTGRMKRIYARMFYIGVGVAILGMAIWLFINPVS